VHKKFDHFWISNLNNFADKNSNLIKFIPFMQNFIGYLMQFDVLNNIKVICAVMRRGIFCVHKPSFLMPDYN